MANALYNLIIRRRTIRLFRQREISLGIIKRIVNAARLAPSAANFQFLEYLVITKPDLREKTFPHTRWGGYVYPKRVPSKERRPSAYIIILINKRKSEKPDIRDVGAAAENILLTATSFSLGGCWIKSLERSPLRKTLKIPSHYIIDSLIALGYPAESPKLEEADNVKYWLDKKNRLHVPKRPLENITHYNSIKR
ncbi:MAG: nitroreductase family protein [Candidatus Omnitrophota bacterium]|nr:MAG: nitroreductase family protein [Candidatus Omnitrophota bacterium]